MDPTWFFCMWIFTLTSITSCKDCPLPTEWFCHPCQKSFQHLYKGFISGLFYFTVLYVCLYTTTTLFLYLFSKFWNQQVSSPTFFFKIVLAIWGPLRFYMIFRMVFFYYYQKKKVFWDFGKERVESVDRFR